MALDRIHLRKLLKILFLEQDRRISAVRSDIRTEIAKESGEESSGGDFYAPFWADAKDHVFGIRDLREAVDARIAVNFRRGRLYPLLRNGFLTWWNDRRRWTNEPFRPGRSLKTHFAFPGLDATVKIDSILSVRDGLEDQRAVYPYFAEKPILSERAAQLGLWLLTSALPVVPQNEMRILDVIRGQTFSLDRTPLRGDEEAEFRHRYTELLASRDSLRSEYD